MYICIKEINGYKVGKKINHHTYKNLPDNFKACFKNEFDIEEPGEFDIKKAVEDMLHGNEDD